MRISPKTGLIASSLLCTAVAAGVAAPAMASPAGDQPGSPTLRPMPQAGSMLDQTKDVRGATDVLQPVTDLLNVVLKAENGKAPAAKLDQHKKAIDKAVAASKRERTSPAGEQVLSKARADLQQKTGALVKASKSAKAKQVQTEARNTVQAAANYLAGTAYSGKLPAPNLKGLPKAPAQNVALPQG